MRQGLRAVLAVIFASLPALAQAEFTYAYRSATATTPVTIQPNGNIPFPVTNAGSSSELSLLVSNRTTFAWTLTRVTMSGPGFSSPTTSVAIGPGETLPVLIRFSPASGGSFSGTVSLQLDGNSRTNTPIFFLSGTAQAPDFVYSYILNPGGNQLAIANGGTIRFSTTNVNENSTATFVINNRGTGRGTINQVTVTGEAFRLSGLPLLPNQVLAERELRFTITFAPTSRAAFRETLRLEVDGTAVIVFLEGQGAGALYSFQTILNSAVTNVPEAGPISFPNTDVNATTTLRVRIRNDGNAQGRIASITSTGTAYLVADRPALPANLPPGGILEFTLSFTPRESGEQPGRLLIDSLSLPITGTSIGATLRISAATDTGTVQLPNNSTLNFPNTPVGSRTRVDITIQNSGNAEGVVNSIAASGAGFSLTGLGPLPIRLAPGATSTFIATFAPETTGSITGVLQIDDIRINLRGAASAPPALPPVILTLPSATQPLQQPAASLRLESPYSLPLTGRLTLTFASESFSDDPAIQFSTGGRTVDFRIPENTTEAIFSDGSRQIQFQSGTVAGTISISSTLAVAAVNVTPSPAPSQSVAVAAAEPRLTGLQLANRTPAGFDLLVSGYSTPRSVMQMRLEFAAGPGTTLQNSTLETNVDSAFTAWYQSAASRTFGSQFVAVIRVNGAGDLDGLQLVTVAAVNARGTSNRVSLNLR